MAKGRTLKGWVKVKQEWSSGKCSFIAWIKVKRMGKK